VVDGHMRSPDDPNVYALGECAQWRSSIHGRPEQIAEQARVIADQLCARYSEQRYRGQRLAVHYELAGLSFTTMGRPENTDADDVAQSSEPLRDRYKKLVLRRGRLISAILVGDLRQAEGLTRLFQSSAPVSPEAQASLFDLSLPVDAAMPAADTVDPPSTPLAAEPELR
jgi:nitrite reductase (NADH) large subunit